MLNYNDIKDIFSYNPDTGDITWKVAIGRNGGRAKPGDIAGCISKDSGYRLIRYNKILYKSHRLAWLLYYKGSIPGIIDHINGIKSNNRIANLRQASKSENTTNSKPHKDNKIGYKNLSMKDDGYAVQIRKHGKCVYKWFPLEEFSNALKFRDDQLNIMHANFAKLY